MVHPRQYQRRSGSRGASRIPKQSKEGSCLGRHPELAVFRLLTFPPNANIKPDMTKENETEISMALRPRDLAQRFRICA